VFEKEGAWRATSCENGSGVYVFVFVCVCVCVCVGVCHDRETQGLCGERQRNTQTAVN
jgi:hypothetical protein